MPSIWLESADGKLAKRVHRGLPRRLAVHVFSEFLAMAQRRGEKVERISEIEALLSRKGGGTAYAYIEMLSPPSGDEEGQPKRRPPKKPAPV